MHRRDFLKTTAAGMAALAVPIQSLSGRQLAPVFTTRSTSVKHWVWIPIRTGRSDDDWKRMFALMRESGVQAILPEVYNGRNGYFGSKRLPVKNDLLGKILPLAAAEGLEVHAWMWSMPCLVEEIVKSHPDWYNVNALGDSAVDKPAYVDYYKFLDPGHPEVREWVQGTVKELASIAELKGIHLDYIRHPDAILPSGLWSKYHIVQDKVYPQYDYGYSQYERSRFRKKHGVDPLQIKDPQDQRKWLQFRLNTVVDLVNDWLVPAAHAKGKTITAAVFPGPSMARVMVRQDWSRFKLDAFLPMLYNVFYETGAEWVRGETLEGVLTVTQPVYSGLFVHGITDVEFTQLVEMALQGGASGVSIFSADAMDDAKWQALRRITEARHASRSCDFASLRTVS